MHADFCFNIVLLLDTGMGLLSEEGSQVEAYHFFGFILLNCIFMSKRDVTSLETLECFR